MLKFLILVTTIISLAACGPKVVDQFKFYDAEVKVFEAACTVESVKEQAREMGADDAIIAKFKQAEITFDGKTTKGCVYYFNPNSVFVGDELGRSGRGEADRGKK